MRLVLGGLDKDQALRPAQALAQLSGTILMPSEPDSRAASSGYLAGVREVRFRRRVSPGETITLRSALDRVLGSAGIFEVSAEVIDGPQSVVFQQGHNRLHNARAVMAFVLGVR